jgi:hypothetical protein
MQFDMFNASFGISAGQYTFKKMPIEISMKTFLKTKNDDSIKFQISDPFQVHP